VDEITEEFLVESREAVDRLDRDLILLEASPSDKELLGRIFRALHTIKGTCGFLGFEKLQRVAHAGEGLLSRLRDGAAVTTPEIASALLATVDAIREMLDAIQATEHDGESDYEALALELLRLAEGDALATPADEESARAAGDAHEKRAVATSRPVDEPAPSPERGPDRTNVIPLVAVAASEHTPAAEAAPAPAAQVETVRVDVELLDRLMDLAGELVLTRNQVRQIQVGVESPALATASQRLNLVTAGLQEGIMKMRMQSVEHLFGKFPRIVRDTAKQCGKQARVELDGKDAELDRTLLEAIKDPLTHLIRNAVDHGIEAPAVRAERGKPREGVVRVRAYHEGGHVSIEISDDGAGIPIERVRAKAVAKGLFSAERAAQLTEAESTNLIFLPGLSTANAVTNVSGRGVGMDVVKTNVERLGGTVEVETKAGQGTTFRLKLPLTLAIIPAVVVEAGGQRYAIPQVHLQELVLLDRSKQKLESVCDAPVFRLRDRLLPIVFLSESIGESTREACMAQAKAHLAILQVNGLLFGLVVDRVIDQQEIVVKPLAPQLEAITTYSACTILGDGRVVLILDVAGIALRAHITRIERTEPLAVDVAAGVATGPSSSFLLVAEAHGARVALPLERVARLETVPLRRLERSGASEVLQFEEGLIPLLRLQGFLPAPPTPVEEEGATAVAAGHANVVVVVGERGSVGIVVLDVVDVVDLNVVLDASVADSVLASVVIDGRVTDILNLDWLIERAGIPQTPLLRSA
jgi:two-component system chemotaxis sensor kinase CheA